MHIRKEEKMFDIFGKRKKTELELKNILLLALCQELDSIKEWNEETFPDATLGGQLSKLEEEYEEYFSAKSQEEERKELADIFIVLGGLRRWESHVGRHLENKFAEDMPFPMLGCLLGEVQKKMKINRKRVWKKSGDGKFHHTNKE